MAEDHPQESDQVQDTCLNGDEVKTNEENEPEEDFSDPEDFVDSITDEGKTKAKENATFTRVLFHIIF